MKTMEFKQQLSQNIVRRLKQDERTVKNTEAACVRAVLVTYLFLTVEIVVKAARKETCGWEVALILLISAVLLLARKDRTEILLPRTLSRKLLPTGTTAKAKHTRLKQYFMNSCAYAAIFSVLELLYSSGLNVKTLAGISPISTIVTFLFLFVLFLAISFLWGEHMVKRYNRICSKLEEESESEDGSE
ncbi:MAG TPA: hypothetical protein VHR42_07205 [Clostridia bacterium]|nr:hypothetical protein [Clostridia bacterium]